MSSSDGDDSGPGRREVAYRIFAAEFDDADFSYSESDEERAPNYVVTPSGARVNRLFLVGVLTETEWVNDDMLRARVVDPTGPFVTYAGQYQPEALGFLERTEPPAFLAVTGKARTFEPEDGDRVFTSVRPESISEVDGDTRDRWVVEAAKRTIERVERMAAAMKTGHAGDELIAALEADGLDHATASGIALALDHYETTPDYLAVLRDLAEDTLQMVAGEIDEVGKLTIAPDEGSGTAGAVTDQELSTEAGATTTDAASADDTGSTATTGQSTADDSFEPPSEGTAAGREPADESVSVETNADSAEVETAASELATDSGMTAGSSAESELTTADEPAPAASDTEPESATVAEATIDDDTETDSTDETDELGDFEADVEADIEDEVEEELGDFDPEEDDALTEAERAEVEAEFDTGFSTGNEVEAEPELEPDTEPSEAEPEPSDEAAGSLSGESEPTASASEPDTDTESAAEVPLDEAVMDAMTDLDGGDGADQEELVATVAERTGASTEEIDAAIEDALMSGRCYEPADGVLKPI